MKTHSRPARGKVSPRTLAKIVLLTAGAIFLGWLCARAAALEVLARRNPAVAVSWAPRDPRIAIGAANIEFRARQGALTPTTSERAVEALQRAPLASDPFFFAGLRELVRGNNDAASELIGEARRRNPRSRMTRLIYLDGALRAGRIKDAAVEIATVSRLVPETSKILVPELARYAADTKTAPALIEALRPAPELREAVLAQLAASGADPNAILRLAASGPPARETSAIPEWQGRLLATLVEKGDVTRAKALWSGFAGVENAGALYGVYDGSFRGAPGPAPFNWKLSQNAAGVAERTTGPALQVEYYGRADTELASQLLQLQAGPHVLSLVAAGKAPASRGGLAWTLTCARGAAQIATLSVNSIDYTPKRLETKFVVPPSCPAQWLRLTGTSSEFPAAHSVTISNLQIRKSPGS